MELHKMWSMTPTEYIQNVLRSESHSFQISDPRILHGAMGCCTEAGELLDEIKKHIFYGKSVDATNIREELGDLLWYAALLCDALHMTFEEIMEVNIAKLRQRYPEKFTEEKATNRNLDAERKILEGRDFGYTEDDNGRP